MPGKNHFATDITSPNGTDSSQALNVLSARQGQQATPALLPVNDPQLMVAGQFSIGKTSTFRMLNDQPLLAAGTNTNQNASAYCPNMVNLQSAKLQGDRAKETGFASPVPATGNNLARFLGARLAASFTNLNCQNFGLTNPVTVTTDGNGVATAVTYNTARQTATATGAAPTPGATPAAGATASATPAASTGTGTMKGGGSNQRVPKGRRGHHQNAAGM